MGASVSENQLQDFIIDGKDLSPEVKSQLATYLYARPVTFDAELDLLVDTHSEPAPFCTITPAPWVNPDSKIAAAQKAYQEALAAAQPPPLVRSPPVRPSKSSWPMKRPGFA